MDELQKEYGKQVDLSRKRKKISTFMLLVGMIFVAVALMNHSRTPVMILFFVLTVGACVVGVLVGEKGKKEFSSYVGQTVTRRVMEQYFDVDAFIMNGETPLDEIRMTELYWDYNRIIGSRVVRGKLEQIPFQCSNVALDETTGTANKNNRVFSGQYVFLTIPEKVNGTVRVIDKLNPVRTLVQGCRPVKLSSVLEFDEQFEVSATDQNAARTYLTEEKRKQILELKELVRKKGGEENAQVSLMVKGNRLYAALGDGVFLFHRQNEHGSVQNVIEYNQLDAEFVQKAVSLLSR